MFKHLILASATAVVALAATADHSGGSLSLTSSAEAKAATKLAQATQLKPATRDTGPTRKPSTGVPVDPKRGPGNYAPNPFVDLYGQPYYPAVYEGLPGNYYCSFLTGGDTVSKAVQVKVRNQGTKIAGPVQVVFEFAGGKRVKQTLPMNVLAASYIFEAVIPPSAWQSGTAAFTIRIDHPNKVAESNEANNTISSFCMGPEG
ncbi:MAG: CARDB domain-containing protein [Kiloniellaceae bacterium]